MDFSTTTLALILAVSFGSAIIGGMGGFGTGIMLTAALTPILGIKAVVPILALAGIIINGGRFWFYRRDFDIRIVKLMLPPALLLLGTYLYQKLDAAHLSIAIGVVVMLAIPARRFLQSRNLYLGTTGLVIGGGLFGFFNGLASGKGSWIASRLVHKLGAKLHIVVIEALIVVGGSSIFVHGLRAR